MTAQNLISWFALAISLFNTVVSLWLGLTVLFNAERRSWGVVLAFCGLLASGGFFFAHSILISQGIPQFIRDLSFWWHIFWAPVVVAPYIWYLLMLWFSGYWDDANTGLHRRQRPWFWLSVGYTLLLCGLLIVANPFPGIAQPVNTAQPSAAPGNIPLIFLVFPLYILLCIALSLDALLRPAPSGRVMGDLARKRARPWLISASLVLFLVSLVASSAMLWLVQMVMHGPSFAALILPLSRVLSALDLVLLILLMTTLLLLGQAIVSYEIFTGKTLPRRGFQRQWHTTLILAAIFCSLAAWGVIVGWPVVFIVLGALVFMAFSYALFSRQGFSEREQGIQQLRPLVSDQHLYAALLSPSNAQQIELGLSAAFSALCGDVLGASRAALIPLGLPAGLADAPLVYPPGSTMSLPALSDLRTYFTSPFMIGLPLDPARYDGAIWVAPLWSERGLNGLLFLGERSDGGYYSLEEIEIARASSERLVDIQAMAWMSRQLVLLQRHRLAEGKVLDQQTRRILHDDVLPRLHAALLELNVGQQPADDRRAGVIASLTAVHHQISDLLRAMPRLAAPEVARLGLFGALRETLDGELQGYFAHVDWNVTAEVEEKAQGIEPLTAEVTFFAAREALRNAARHAEPIADLAVKIAAAWHGGLEIVIEDNGAGQVELKPESSGQGLTLHSTMMAVIGGSLALESGPGLPTRVILHLPEE